MKAIRPEPSIQLLVRLLRRDAAGVERALRARSNALDELASAALEGGLAIVLLRALDDCALAHEVSGEHRRLLARRRERHTERCLPLERGLVEIARQFRGEDVPFILLKGPYLGARFYGDVRGREYRDLDILVRRADRRHAFDLLERAGFARRSRVLFSEALTTFFVHAFDFVAGGVSLDLHWSLSRHASVHIDERDVWARKTTFSLDRRTYDVLADDHEVMLQALALLRDIERGRTQMKNFVDLIQVVASIDATMRWDALLADGRSSGTRGPLVNVLSLCLDVANARDLAPRLAAALEAQSARRVQSLTPAIAGRAAGYANRLWAARSYDTTLATCLGWWFVSLPFRRAVHGWPRPVPPKATPTS
jgi:Uncharacterised nucleotidyltransferase